jgi:hypothetical protein
MNVAAARGGARGQAGTHSTRSIGVRTRCRRERLDASTAVHRLVAKGIPIVCYKPSHVSPGYWLCLSFIQSNAMLSG